MAWSAAPRASTISRGSEAAADAGSTLAADSSTRIVKSSRLIAVHLPLDGSGPAMSGVQRA
jgi:hypothetical protein